ncbi:MAG TPA: cytochrome P450 [Usitatibacter sp.]|nr:cytochrome P450 [Usitatibacter sp.]
MDQAIPAFTPPHVAPIGPRGRLAFLAAALANPLQTIPGAVYEEDVVARPETRRFWITEPGLIRKVLLEERDKYQKLTQIKLLSPLLGKGILTSEGGDWKWQRQASAPMFRPQDLSAFVPTFVRAADDVVARWRAVPGGTVHAVAEDMTRATFDVIAATLLPSPDAAFADDIQRGIRTLQRSGAWDILYVSMGFPGWLPRPGMFRSARAVHALRSRVLGVVKDREAAGQAARATDDLLGRLIAARDPESGRSMDDGQLVDNLLTFYLAGHETTAKGLTWMLYLMSRSPQWSARLEDEVDGVAGTGAIGAEHVERLVLTQQVVKEAMRLYPPVPIMTRQVVAEASLGGHALSPGTSVMMSIYAIQRHAKRWARPHEFDPSRFSPENEAKIPRYQYMPFGAGPRICIGMPFAMLEATAILATLVQRARFRFAGAEEPLPVARVTLSPRGGMPLAVTMRP